MFVFKEEGVTSRMVWEGYFCSFLSLVLLSPYRPCDWTMLPSIINSTAWRTNQTLGGAYKDPDGTRVRESICLSFVCSPTSVVVLLLVFVVVFLPLSFLCVKLCCLFAVSRCIRVYSSPSRPVVMGPVQHVT